MSKSNITANYLQPSMKYFKRDLNKRLHKQRTFFIRKDKGDILLYINYKNRGLPHPAWVLYNLLANIDIENLCDDKIIENAVSNYVGQLRMAFFSYYSINDDALPACTDVFFNMGVITSAMTGERVRFEGQTTICNPSLNWAEIENLKFDIDNPWIRFSHIFHKALWKFWDEDYLIGGFWHSSPLDAALAIRGSRIFEDMYLRPDDVKELISWCVNWSIQVEKAVNSDINIVKGYRGTLNTLIPDRAIFVNADPIDLISNEHAKIFDIPFTSKLFSSLKGGFYHHHSKGIHQVSHIAEIKNISVQNITNDFPATPDLAETIINQENIKEQIIKSSFKVPIMIDSASYHQINRLIPILREGRFIIDVICDNYVEALECVKKINKINSLN